MWLPDLGLAYHLADRMPRDVFLEHTAAENSDAFTLDPVTREPPMPAGKSEALRSHYEPERTFRLSGMTVTLLTAKH
ncbi:hypothetical protein ACTVZO_43420 [Streptomyces sp. IBSNAI002]|uniref:hypothetical protein n=1 Tax=Streptomyces sp. IBSNAI002 TaxID=3457500 RepID=UPI003FD567B9